ncbi:MAG: O-antigen ligase family protein [Candidatus Binatia bacterium]
MSPNDRRVLLGLQFLIVAVPLLLGGRQAWTVALAGPVVLALLFATLRARTTAGGGPPVTGVAALTAFVAIALLTTVPLPPFLVRVLAPATARLYADMLPGWPGGGDWSVWRTLAIDPYGVWVHLGRLALGFGVFAVIVAYPWRSDIPGEAGEAPVLARLLLTLIVGASVLATVALIEQIAGNGDVLWISGVSSASRSRASGPFVNPNHFAAWLEMIVPVALGYAVAVGTRVRRHIVAAAQAGRGMGVNARRAWIAAIIANQRALALPLASGAAVLLMIVAHFATGSRAGSAALLVGLAIAVTGMVANVRRRSRHSAIPSWVPTAVAGVLVLGSLVTIAVWATAGDDQRAAASDGVDVSLTSRLAVAAQGRAILAEHPLFGTGMGSWLHAFRPHQAPPVEGGIWDHAHNDYLELAAESGVAGTAAALVFCIAVTATLMRQRQTRRTENGEGRRSRTMQLPPGFEIPEWRAALRDGAPLRWGLAGGIGAILVHSLMEFGLRMPANLLTLMLVVALLVIAGRPRPAAEAAEATLSLPPAVAPPGHAPALAMLLALLVVAATGPALDTVRTVAGVTPLSPRTCLVESDLVLAEEGDSGRDHAATLVHQALDWSPADRDAHEAAAAVAGVGPEGDDHLRRAIALSPWAPELRDALALRLSERGLTEQAAAEIEESMFRFPYLVSHDYMSTATELGARTPAALLRALADGDTVPVRLAALDDVTAGAIERGLTRALTDMPPGDTRAGILNDLALLLEARARFADASTLLRAEASQSQAGRSSLARAARNALRVNDLQGAEETLLAALADNPEQGRLYRDLAVNVYAARGDFASAETVLNAGERNALDMLPVHRGMTEFLERRAAAEDVRAASAWAVSDTEAAEAEANAKVDAEVEDTP